MGTLAEAGREGDASRPPSKLKIRRAAHAEAIGHRDSTRATQAKWLATMFRSSVRFLSEAAARAALERRLSSALRAEGEN